MGEKKVNFEIDLLKFCFAIVVVFHHWHFHGFAAGHVAVEFFFIVSGYFFTKSIVSAQASGERYIVKSIKNLWPNLFAGIILCLLWNFFFNNWTLGNLRVNLQTSLVGELLLVQMFGLPVYSSTGVVWYLSAMYIGMAVLLLLFKRNGNKIPRVLLLLAVLFIYGWLTQHYSCLNNPGLWIGHVSLGTMRGIAGIALGALCFEFSNFLKGFGFNKKGKAFLSFLEVVLYLHVVFYVWRRTPSFWDFYVVLALFVAVSISLSEVSFFSFLNRYNIPFFRKASICVLFSHFCVVQYFEKNYPQFSGREARALVLLQVVVLSLLNYFLAKLVKELTSKIVFCFKDKDAPL